MTEPNDTTPEAGAADASTAGLEAETTEVSTEAPLTGEATSEETETGAVVDDSAEQPSPASAATDTGAEASPAAEPQPVEAEPQPAAPEPEAPGAEPAAAAPAAEEPAAAAPAAEEPAAEPEAPAAEEPAAAAPAAEEPAAAAPAAEEPAAAAPAAEEPAAAAPAAEEPAAEPEAPAAEEPAAAAPAAEEPAPAAPAAEEPAAEPEAPAAEPGAPEAAPEASAGSAPAPGAMPKPGEEGYDPDQGLGLPDAAALLGPPNMGGFESGEIVEGTVLTVTPREAEVDLGNGKVGVIGDRHWSSGSQVDLTGVLKTGDSVAGAVLARADAKKRITLSRLWAQQKRGWEQVETAAKDKSNVTATVTSTVKGGLSLDVNGVRAFMPAAMADVNRGADIKALVGETVEVRVIEADRNKQRLIVSRKSAMAKAALSGIEVGQTFTGKVAQITDFGAFVDVAGVRGLLHKSEIGWSRARDPQRDLRVGQEIEVTVVKVQPARNRLGLSTKTGSDPFKTIKKGDRYEASVTRLVDFGAFVGLPGGIEGLVHVSEMAEYRVFAPEEIVIPGERVWVKVLKVDRRRRTIDLSMAQAVVPDPPEEQAAREAEAAKAQAATADAAGDATPAGDDDYAEDGVTPEAASSEDE